MEKKRVKKKETTLFFDSFKHFKNNFCNLICLELPALVSFNNVKKYLELKPVNYKSKFPDMRKIGLIDYEKPSDFKMELTEEGKIIYDIIKIKKDKFEYDITEKSRLDTIKPTDLWEILDKNESKIIKEQLIKLLLSYYDTADCLRPYLLLIKLFEHLNIQKIDFEQLCNILANPKVDVLFKNIKSDAYIKLDEQTKIEIRRPISYIINALETAGIIDEFGNIIYDREFLKEIIMNLDEIYYQNKYEIKEYKGRSADEQRKFREQVLAAYDYKCAITGNSICITKFNHTKTYLLEAAHIIPYHDSGSFSVTNGIALSVEMHKMFDNKLFAFEYNKDGNIEVIVTKSKNVIDETGILKSIDHKIISLPKNVEQYPDYAAINYRKEKYLLE